MLLGEELLNKRNEVYNSREELRKNKELLDQKNKEEELKRQKMEIAARLLEQVVSQLKSLAYQGEELRNTILLSYEKYLDSKSKVSSFYEYANVESIVLDLALEKGISFVFDGNNKWPKMTFEIMDYSDDCILKILEEPSSLECFSETARSTNEIENWKDYFQLELKMYQYLKGENRPIEEIQNSFQSYISSEISECDKKRISTAFSVALYRLGYNVEPYLNTHWCFCSGVRYHSTLNQRIYNCMEIMHRINKEKMIQQMIDENFDDNKNKVKII